MGFRKGRLVLGFLFASVWVQTPSPAQDEVTQRFEETDLTLVGDWDAEANDLYSDGAAILANFDAHRPGATALLEFEGSGIYWIGAMTFNAGLLDWIIDEGTPGEVCGRVDTYFDGVERFRRILLVDELEDGPHTIKLVSLGHNRFGEDLPSETYIDALDVILEAGERPPPDMQELIDCEEFGIADPDAEQTLRVEETDLTFDGPSQLEDHEDHSQGAAAVMRNGEGTTVGLEFEGIGVYWVGVVSTRGGYFDWIVDEGTPDQTCGRVDTFFGGTRRAHRILLAEGLADAPHTLRILVLEGTRPDQQVHVDAIDVVTREGNRDEPERQEPIDCARLGEDPVPDDDSIVLEAVADVWLRESEPDRLSDSDLVSVWSSVGNDGARRYGVIAFDVGNLAGRRLERATLSLWAGPFGFSDDFKPIRQTALAIDTSEGTAPASMTWRAYQDEYADDAEELNEFGTVEFEPFGPEDLDQFVESSADAADLRLIEEAADSDDGLLTLIFVADEDGTDYAKSWGDGSNEGGPSFGEETPALLSVVLASEDGPRFVRGDANADERINITDGVFILDFLFGGATELSCREAANANGEDDINITDGIYVLQFLFGGGPAPPAPHPECGAADGAEVECASFAPCE